MEKLKKAYMQQKHNAKTRGVGFTISFEDWLSVWEDSGHLLERGRGADKYCMCRCNDTGDYALGNVFIEKGSKNVSDGNKGKTDSLETRLKKSISLKGIERPYSRGELNPMHRQESKEKMSKAVGGVNNYKAKEVITPFGVFGTTKQASVVLGVNQATVQWRCRNSFNGWSYGNLHKPRSSKCTFN
jgi:hypothetical protein